LHLALIAGVRDNIGRVIEPAAEGADDVAV